MKKLATLLALALAAACGGNSSRSGPCTSGADCSSGLVCCVSLGNTCAAAANCPPATCQRPVTGTASTAQVILHETHNVGDFVKFTVPANTGSVSILQQAKVSTLQVQANGSTFENSAVPITITGPAGQKIFNVNDSYPSSPDGGTDPSGAYALFGGGQASTAAFTIPNTTYSLNAGVPGGDWNMQVSDYAYLCSSPSGGCTSGGSTIGSYDVTVLARPLPAASEAARLDVNVYIVANSGTTSQALFTATSAKADPSVQRFVSSFQSLFAAAGVGINANVAFFDVSDANRARFGTNINAALTGPCDELDQMFLLSSTNSGNAVNLFLVQGIQPGSTSSGSGIVVGIDGSIPGPSTLNGTVHSGAVISAADLYAGQSGCGGKVNPGACGADRVAYIAAHETGHFLGLFHTTEMEGADFDPLTDTGKCPCLPCALPSDQPSCTTAHNKQLVTAQQCTVSSTCSGGDNLMFWLLQTPYSTGALTPQQAKVMRLNPAVHP